MKYLITLLFLAEVISASVLMPFGAKEIENPKLHQKSVRQTVQESISIAEPKAKLDREALKNYRAEHPFSELNQMTYPDLVDLLVTLDWQDIPGLFSSSDESIEFFKDSARYQYMMDALEQRGEDFNGTDELGIPMLVEVLRAGSYIAWSESELAYIKQGEPFIDRMEKPIVAIASNLSLSWDNSKAVAVMEALGYAIGIGVCTPEIVEKVAPLFTSFNTALESNMLDRDKSGALYRLGNGINHGLVNVDIYKNKEQAKTAYAPKLEPLLSEIEKIMDFGTLHEDYTWLINNGVWWYGNFGQISNDVEVIANELLEVIDIYGKWEEPSLQALSQLTDSYKPYKDYNDLNEEEIKEELKSQLLPKFYRFDDGEFIFRCGADVTEKKVKQLYWALKEVKAQFLRYSLRHDPLELGNADDSLTAVIYNNPTEYDNNNFLWGLSTDNGGMYIENWGTFFTYERTPQQSIYSLEDLFRHELTHYLQGRFQTEGSWGEGIYNNDRLTWFEEGGAEYTAGASRFGIPSRLNMVESVQSDGVGLMKLSEVVHATYASGFTFYTYAFALFDYLHNKDIETLFQLIKACNKGDAAEFDNIINAMKNNTSLAEAYEKHKQDLVDNIGNLENAGVSEDYFMVESAKTINDIEGDIDDIVSLSGVTTTQMSSNYFITFRVRGEVEAFSSTDTISDWYKMDSLANVYLHELENKNWSGYKTTVCYFSNYRIENGKAIYDVTFEGMLDPGATPLSFNSLSNKECISLKVSEKNVAVTFSGVSGKKQIRLYNLKGRLIRNLNIPSLGLHQMNLENISSGHYILRVRNGDNSLVQKLSIGR